MNNCNSFLRHSFLAELRNSSGRMAMLERELGGLCKEFSAVKVLNDVPLLLTLITSAFKCYHSLTHLVFREV